MITVILTKPDKFGPQIAIVIHASTTICSYSSLPHSTTTWHLPTVSFLTTTKETGKHPHTGSTTLNIFFFFFQNTCSLTFFPQHILPILCLPSFKFFFFSTPLPYKTLLLNLFSFPASMHACYSPFSQNNCLRNEINTYLVKFPWQIGIQCPPNYHPSTFNPIHDTQIGYFTFPTVSHDLPSGNDIGLHTIRLLLTFDSWLSLLTQDVISKLICSSTFQRIILICSTLYHIFYISPMLTWIPLSVMFYPYHLHLCKTRSSP